MADVILQPFRGVQVQVVRRLVQEQNFSIYQNQPGQVDAGLFPFEMPRPEQIFSKRVSIS